MRAITMVQTYRQRLSTMFAPNTNTQLAFDDSTLGLTERELNALRNSWAQTFRDEIFPYIDEELFSVLYSDAYSRPNAPVNVIVGALLKAPPPFRRGACVPADV